MNALQLDGVFLMVDTFDGAPPDLNLEERMHYALTHAGPSIFIASLTDIAAFLTAAFTPIPAISYYCVTVAFCLIIANVILFTWFCAWMYTLEKTRMEKAAAAGETELAKINGGSELVPTPLGLFFEKLAVAITIPWVKVLIIGISLGLFASAPYGISKVTPDYGPKDFIKGCGVFCDISYLGLFTEEHEEQFPLAPMPVTLMIQQLDINTGRAAYLSLISEIASGVGPVPAMASVSWYDGFCASKVLVGGCSATTSWNTADVQAFLQQQPAAVGAPLPAMFGRDLKLSTDAESE